MVTTTQRKRLLLASIDRKEILNKSTGKITIRYYIRYYEGTGKGRKRKTLPGGFTRKHDAEVALGRMLAEQAAGTFGLPDQEILFREDAAKWLEEKEPEIGIRTIVDYKEVVNKHLLPAFGDRQIKQIESDDIVAFRNEKHKKVSPRTTNKILRVLKMVFAYAEDNGHLNKNPARKVRGVKQPKEEMDFLGRVEPDEIERFLAASSPEFHPLFFTAIWTGAREGELFALKWGNVDFEKQRINIRQTYDSYGYREPKSKASKRSIIMSPSLVEVLSQHKATLEKNGNDDHVFQNTKGGPLHQANVTRREFHPALERADIRRIRFHDLRHTYGALTASMGVPPKFIQNQLGHASLTVTLDTYGHLMPSAYVEFGDSFDNFVRNLSNRGKN